MLITFIFVGDNVIDLEGSGLQPVLMEDMSLGKNFQGQMLAKLQQRSFELCQLLLPDQIISLVILYAYNKSLII